METVDHILGQDITPSAFISSVTEVFGKTRMFPFMLDSSVTAPLLVNETFLASLLTIEERNKLLSFKLPKRQREWLGGRICSKLAIKQQLGLVIPHLKSIAIRNDTHGRPYYILADTIQNSGINDISISHSGECAMAVAANTFCGVDIQEPKESLLRVKRRFCQEQEFILMKNCQPRMKMIALLNMLWAAKEAVRKACSHKHIPGFLEIELRQCSPCAAADYCKLLFQLGSETVVALSGTDKDFALAACFLKDYRNA